MSRAALSPAAGRDIREIAAWIADDNPVAAEGFRFALDRLATQIGIHPKIGPFRPEIATPPVRFLPLRGFPYVVVYTAEREPPLILRVLHGARNLPEILGDT